MLLYQNIATLAPVYNITKILPVVQIFMSYYFAKQVDWSKIFDSLYDIYNN